MEEKEEKQDEVKETKKYELKDTFGSGQKTKEVEAEEMVIGEGYAGASNNAYYIKEGKLYHMTLDNFKEELLAENPKLKAEVPELLPSLPIPLIGASL